MVGISMTPIFFLQSNNIGFKFFLPIILEASFLALIFITYNGDGEKLTYIYIIFLLLLYIRYNFWSLVTEQMLQTELFFFPSSPNWTQIENRENPM